MPKLKVTPLYGARGSDRAPLCSILRIDDDCNILLDCGWDDLFDPGLLENLKPIAPTVTAVLISHPDTLHLGALPYAVKRFGLKAPVYSTLPVHKMGQMFLYDQFLSRQATEDFECFSLDDVDEAFAKFHTLQYSQTANLAAKGKKIAVTPFNAGHLLGGTVWRINVDGEDIVYAVDINHRKDRHLNGATIEQVFDKPALMITSASNALISPVSKQVRDRDLLTSIMQTVRQDGNVLLPVDPAGRVLELICLLEEHWQRHQLGSYHLVFLTMVAYNTMEFAKSQLEWMNASFTTSFEHTRTNAFDTKYLRLCHTKADLQRLPRGPKVVLASLGSMQSGAAKELLVDYAMSPKNLIIFTERPVHGSLAHQLQTQASDNIRIQLSKRVPLEGLELAQHLESVERQRVQRAEGGGDGVDKGGVNGDGADAKVKVEDGLDALQFERGASGALTRLTAAKRTSSSLVTVTEHGFEGVLMEGFTPTSDAAGPLFPYDEGEGEAAGDEYGELIDASRFDFSGGEAMAPLPTVAEAPPEQPMEVDTRPTKVHTIGMNLSVRAAIMVLDFEGQSDGYSIKTIIGNIGPRELVIVAGSNEAVQTLTQGVKGDSLQSVFAPQNMESVEVSSALLTSVSMKMSDDLMASIKLQKAGNYSIAWINAAVEQQASASGELQHVLNPVQRRVRASNAAAFVGDLNLGDLRQDLISQGIKTELVQGVLICDGLISIYRADDQNEITMEGPLSSLYYRVRDIVYSQYVVC